MYLLTKTTRAVPSASCRVHVELSWKTPRQRATLWAIIMPPPNEALADPSLPLYSALSLSLPLRSPPLSSMDRSSASDSSRHHSVSLPGIRTLFPGIISGQRIFFRPKLIYPTRSSLGYRRQKLSSAIHPYPALYCMSILLCLPLQTVETAIV